MSGTAGSSTQSNILVAERTRRPNALNNFQKYNGGWNLSSSSYLAVMDCNLFLGLCFLRKIQAFYDYDYR